MRLLTSVDIKNRLALRDIGRLSIQPLLDTNQIGAVTIDLRLGYDFLVSVLTRRTFVGLDVSDVNHRGISSYFQSTRRELGERFVLYPNQLVLATTLEYISLPTDVYADVLSRSSYTRLGIAINTMVQPGFRGCFPLELFNHNNNPVELVVGSRIIQTRLFETDENTEYHSLQKRKYFGGIRPIPSKAAHDPDLSTLESIRGARQITV